MKDIFLLVIKMILKREKSLNTILKKYNDEIAPDLTLFEGDISGIISKVQNNNYRNEDFKKALYHFAELVND
ncbi:MAG: hypothetical protein U5K00_22560 [Melioribacteraceae bacterium]|nr:hypothetical protein [Melioribacteraceae bacterium]